MTDWRTLYERKVEHHLGAGRSREEAEATALWGIGHPLVNDRPDGRGGLTNICIEPGCGCGHPRTIEEAKARRRRLWGMPAA